MEDSNSLDSFISGDVGDVSNSAPTAKPSSDRPKLKKIKRIKVRPQTVSLTIPPKATAETVDDSFSTLEENGSLNGINVEDVAAEDIAPLDNEMGTELVKYDNAQDVSAKISDNPYVLDALPPDLEYGNESDDYGNFVDTSLYIKKSIFYLSTLACLFAGVFIGKAFFSSPDKVIQGLEGVVINPDVPAGRPRCGLTDKSQACILYIMNWYRQELNGRDFYKLAAQLTGREEYMIDTDNLRYSNVKIKAGQIAQLNIPALK